MWNGCSKSSTAWCDVFYCRSEPCSRRSLSGQKIDREQGSLLQVVIKVHLERMGAISNRNHFLFLFLDLSHLTIEERSEHLVKNKTSVSCGCQTFKHSIDFSPPTEKALLPAQIFYAKQPQGQTNSLCIQKSSFFPFRHRDDPVSNDVFFTSQIFQ